LVEHSLGKGEVTGSIPVISSRVLDVEIARRFQVSMVAFAVLVAMVWLLMQPMRILISGRAVDIRWLPTLVLGMFAFRTYIHRQAERIRAEDESSRRE
jgi:hypothetical protein